MINMDTQIDFQANRITQDYLIPSINIPYQQLKLLYLNARSLVNKFSDLETILATERPDVLFVTETWFNDKIENAELEFTEHTLAARNDRMDTVGGRGGGVALWCKRSLGCSSLIDCAPGVCGIVLGVVEMYCIYLSPTALPSQRDQVNTFLAGVRRHLVIIGDFNHPNISWPTLLGSSQQDRDFLMALADGFLDQQVHFPTHQAGNLIDLVLTNCSHIVKYVIPREDLSLADHIPIEVVVGVGSGEPEANRLIPDMSKADIASFSQHLLSYDWFTILSGISVKDGWSFFKQTMIEGMNAFVPTKTRQSRVRPPWMHKYLMCLTRKKARLWSRYKKEGGNLLLDNYREIKRQVTNEVRKSKEKYEETLATKSNLRSFYGYVNSRRGTKAKIGPLKDGLGLLTDKDSDMVNILNKQFLSNSQSESGGNSVQTVARRSNITCISFTVAQVTNKIKRLKSSPSEGPDGFSATLFKRLGEAVALPLAILFNKSMLTGSVPKDWRRGNICPIFKGGDSRQAKNYRPISLTSVSSKLMEGLIKDQLMATLEENAIIGDHQHGFRTGRSCTTNLIEHIDFVTRMVDAGKSVDTVYLDLSKAFDRVPHQVLVQKLLAVGVGGHINSWIRSWLTDREQRVVLNGFQSGWSPVHSGVPQGSVLGPLLFIIFANDMNTSVQSNMLSFADDTKIFRCVSNNAERILLQSDLDKLVLWAKCNGMDFNPEKCKVVRFGRDTNDNTYQINGKCLDVVPSHWDLGVLVDCSLKFSMHTSSIVSKANRTLGFTQRNFISRKPNVRVKLYKTYVLPILEYASQVTSPFLGKDVLAIEAIQRRFTRGIMGLHEEIYETRLQRLKLEELSLRRTKHDLYLTYKIVHGLARMTSSEYSYLQYVQETSALTSTRSVSQNHLRKPACHGTVRYNSFFVRIVHHWNGLSLELRLAPSFLSFKKGLSTLTLRKVSG